MKIYFTDWLKRNKVPIDHFLQEVKKSLRISTLHELYHEISNMKKNYVNKLLIWNQTDWPVVGGDNYYFWYDLETEWVRQINNLDNNYEIKFCRPGEISEDLKYTNTKILKNKSKKIKKLKI